MDLTTRPFFLTDEQVAWVNRTRDGLSLEQKAGQLFVLQGNGYPEDELASLVKEHYLGGILFRPLPAEEIKRRYAALDALAPIPLLKAANLEEGGNGACSDATHFGTPLQVAATDDEETVERFATVCAAQGRSVGVNLSYSPVADINLNRDNPITNVRTFGSDAEKVKRFASVFVRAMQAQGVAATAKHFPGDGVDYRDQHLHPTYNSLPAEEWHQTFGAVYKALIDEGLLCIMAGHIAQPNLAREINPALRDEDVPPATLCRELLTGVLRERFGFNGMITTDATVMGGFTQAAERRRAIPGCVEAGCDMLVFSVDFREDLRYLVDGVRDGLLSRERLDEAVTRVLALKAKVATPPAAPAQEIPAARWARESADKAITLVKDRGGILPVTPDRFPRIKLVIYGDDTAKNSSVSLREMMARKLTEKGFRVEGCDDLPDETPSPSSLPRDRLALYVAHVPTQSNQVSTRLVFGGRQTVFRYPHEEPSVMVSLQNPYHLQDVPRMPVFINAYAFTEQTVDAVIAKLTGESEFVGVSPVDAFCGLPDTRF